jgi:hypothetical protein
MRLWVRWRVMRDLGWDDFFVVLAGIMNTVASALVLRSEYRAKTVHVLLLIMSSTHIRIR